MKNLLNTKMSLISSVLLISAALSSSPAFSMEDEDLRRAIEASLEDQRQEDEDLRLAMELSRQEQRGEAAQHKRVPSNDKKDHLSNMPDEVTQNILGFADAKDLASMSQTSKHFHRNAEDEALWKGLSEKEGIKKPSPDTSWKESYKTAPRPEKLLRDLEKALNKEALITSNTTNYEVPGILEMINNGTPIQDIYRKVSNLKMIVQPGAAEGTVQNTKFQGGRFSPIKLMNALMAAGIDASNMDETDMILAAVDKGVPVLVPRGGRALVAIDPNDPAVKSIRAHREYEDAVRAFIRAYEALYPGRPDLRK